MKKFKIQIRETGQIIIDGMTEEVSKLTFEMFEENDKNEGIYVPDFYEIKEYEVTTKFNVVLQIEIEANSPLEAAKTMKEWLEDQANWVYDVQDEETKEIFTIDLNGEDEDAVLPNKIFESLIK